MLKGLLMMLLVVAAFPVWTQESEPTKSFFDFVAPLIEAEWQASVRIMDVHGTVAFEGVDVRRFRRGVGGAYLIEDAYREDPDGSLAHVGLVVAGVDGTTGQVQISSFWPWQPTRLPDAMGSLTQDADGSNQLVILAATSSPGQPESWHTTTCRYHEDGSYQCRTQTRIEAGKAFDSIIATYTKR